MVIVSATLALGVLLIGVGTALRPVVFRVSGTDSPRGTKPYCFKTEVVLKSGAVRWVKHDYYGLTSLLGTPATGKGLLGFAYSTSIRVMSTECGLPIGYGVRAVVVPFWAPVLAFIAYRAIAIARGPIRRRRRRKRNQCVLCGYDLTGNVSGGCPECDKAI